VSIFVFNRHQVSPPAWPDGTAEPPPDKLGGGGPETETASVDQDGSGADDLTVLLVRARKGDTQAAARLMPIIEAELRRMAHQRMREQHRGHTLQTTALMNEAYIRLFGSPGMLDAQRDGCADGYIPGAIRDRHHFMALAAATMRSILVDHARRKRREKRTPVGERVLLDELVDAYQERSADLVALGEALDRLAQADPALVRVVELRFFGGLPVAEVARTLGMSQRTAERELQTARAWLKHALLGS